MNMMTYPPAPSGRLALFLGTVAAFERDEIEAAVDGLIALLDAADGDADAEDDERAALTMRTDGEDFDFEADPIDPDGLPGVPEDAEDGGDAEPNGDEGDASYPEPNADGDYAHSTLAMQAMPSALSHEDAEQDDDDRCVAGDDGCAPVPDAFGNLRWGSIEEDPGVLFPAFGMDQTKPAAGYSEAAALYFARPRAA